MRPESSRRAYGGAHFRNVVAPLTTFRNYGAQRRPGKAQGVPEEARRAPGDTWRAPEEAPEVAWIPNKLCFQVSMPIGSLTVKHVHERIVRRDIYSSPINQTKRRKNLG